VVYDDTVGRTQVYLSDDDLALLDRQTAETGASRSELIRRAVRTMFGGQTHNARLLALQESAGSLTSQALSGADYVDAIRGGDLRERMARSGLR
jgi:Arc/MetJ-type ribon-helix-helix transcriptional regulator